MGVRLWFRLGMVVLIALLGIRAWVLRPAGDAGAPAAGSEVSGPTAGETAASVLTEALRNAEGRTGAGMPWRVTRLSGAEGVLVVEVEADRPDDALAIAEEIIAPLDDSYEEVLIYVRGATPAPDALTHRIQWTPDRGFVEITYSAP
jgi:hypothetical protein